MSKLEKILAIVNPVSNNGKTEDNWPKYSKIFINSGLKIEERFSKYPLHASKIAREAVKNGYSYIMVVGGDGTVNEVVNGLIDNDKLYSKEIKLIIFSQGTGSDLIRSLDLSSKPEKIVELIKRRQIKNIDIIKADYIDHSGRQSSRYFINAADCGLGAEVAARVNRSKKLLDGSISYFFAVFSALYKYNNKNVIIKADGNKIYEGLINTAVAANGKYFGGGIKVAPEAELESGKINFVLLKDFSKFGIAVNLVKGYKGSHLNHPLVESLNAQNISIYTDDIINLEVDGENIGRAPLTFSIIKEKLPVLV